MTSLTWSILVFVILQVIAFGKFMVDLYATVKLLKKELQDNTNDDKEEGEDLKNRIEAISKACEANSKALSNKNEDLRKELYAETSRVKTLVLKMLKEVENKSDSNDKETSKRMDGIAQGLVKVEEKIKFIEKQLDKL